MRMFISQFYKTKTLFEILKCEDMYISVQKGLLMAVSSKKGGLCGCFNTVEGMISQKKVWVYQHTPWYQYIYHALYEQWQCSGLIQVDYVTSP